MRTKIIILIALITTMIFTFITYTFNSDKKTNVTSIEVNEVIGDNYPLNFEAPYINEDDIKIVSDEYAKPQKSLLTYGSMEYSTVLYTNYRTVTLTPEGQPLHGYKLSTGGYISINTDGGSYLPFDFNVSWGTISFRIKTGSYP